MLLRDMQLTLLKKSRFLATAALVAAAFVFSLQTLELQHQHNVDDAQVECLLCKTSADSAPAVAAIDVTESFSPITVTAPLALAYSSTNYLHFPIRGPPA